jgi:3',5'-cyclic AMP phosphodiesterase CpdA
MLAQLSDPHISLGDEKAIAALSAAVAAVARLAPDAVLVSGDLVEHGSGSPTSRPASRCTPCSPAASRRTC